MLSIECGSFYLNQELLHQYFFDVQSVWSRVPKNRGSLGCGKNIRSLLISFQTRIFLFRRYCRRANCNFSNNWLDSDIRKIISKVQFLIPALFQISKTIFYDSSGSILSPFLLLYSSSVMLIISDFLWLIWMTKLSMSCCIIIQVWRFYEQKNMISCC